MYSGAVYKDILYFMIIFTIDKGNTAVIYEIGASCTRPEFGCLVKKKKFGLATFPFCCLVILTSADD